MKQIVVKKMTISNFKGIERFEAHFNQITNIYADNGKGKTSLFDAFLWLFFGKDSEGKSTFEIKRLDKQGQFIPKLNSEVEAIIVVDGIEIAAKKVLQQKWTKRRGSNHEEYAGDENVYFWNDVPLKESDFKLKVSQYITNEQLFMLISNPFYFNSLKWEDRRKMLTSIAPDITNAFVLDKLIGVYGVDSIKPLSDAFSQNKSIAEYAQQISASIKKTKDQLTDLPARIEEAKRSINLSIDFVALKKSANAITNEIQRIDELIGNVTKQNEEKTKAYNEAFATYQKLYQEHQNSLFGKKNKLQSLYNSIANQSRSAATELEQQIQSKNFAFTNLQNTLKNYRAEIERISAEVTGKNEQICQLRNEWLAINAQEFVFDENSCICPTCQQQLPLETINESKETLLGNFNQEKQKKLSENVKAGLTLKDEINALQQRIDKGKVEISAKENEIQIITNEIEKLNEQLNIAKQNVDVLFTSMLQNNIEYQTLLSEISTQEAVVINQPQSENADNQSMAASISQKQQLNIQLQEINRELAKESFNEQQQKRVNELVNMEEKLLQEQNQLEAIDFIITQFNKTKIEAIEESINGLFKYVKFKMFKQQVNGGEAPTCETMINSNGSLVTYTSANNAGRVNAGLDIINAFSIANQISAPVFIDNRESVTAIQNMTSQIINLYVSPTDKELRVL